MEGYTAYFIAAYAHSPHCDAVRGKAPQANQGNIDIHIRVISQSQSDYVHGVELTNQLKTYACDNLVSEAKSCL